MTYYWFIKVLIVFAVLSPLFLLFRWKWSIFLIGALYVIVPIPVRQISLRLNMGEAFMLISWLKGLAYFSTGVFLSSNRIFISRSIGVLSLAFGGFLTVSRLFFPTYGTAISWVAWPFLLVGAVRLVPAITLPKMLSNTAFAVYLLHPFVLRWTRFETDNFIIRIVFTALAVLICLAVVWSLTWMARPLASLLFGGRLCELPCQDRKYTLAKSLTK